MLLVVPDFFQHILCTPPPNPPLVGIAQLVECLTKKLGAILMWVWVPSATRYFNPSQLPAQTLLRCPYSPHGQSHASTSVCTLKIQTWAAVPLFRHRQILHTLIGMGSAALIQTWAAVPLFRHRQILHTLIGMGSAALAAAMLYLGKATQISRKGQRRSTLPSSAMTPWTLLSSMERAVGCFWMIDESSSRPILEQKSRVWSQM